MSRRVINRNLDQNGPPLHQDCFDFLNLLEQHDQVTNCPSIMDDRLWDLLCRMRRAKIESEFRVRSLSAQLIEAETAEQALTKEITYKKGTVVVLDKNISDVKEKKVIFFLYFKTSFNFYQNPRPTANGKL